MTLRGSIGGYFRIVPVRFQDGLRLYAAYATSALLKVFAARRFKSVGMLTVGRRNLIVRVDGVQYQVRPGTNDLDLISPKHEPITTEWFDVGEDDIVVDIGAHIGRYTLRAASKASKVIAVEPDPSNFRLLESNVALNGLSNVVLVSKAMSSRAGPRLLRRAGRSNTGMSTLLPDSSGREASSEDIIVDGETLDHLVGAHALSRIDWLKIDVEGHEVAVLEGAPAALRVTQKMVLEVTDLTREACKRIVETAGFNLDNIEPGSPASNWLLVKRGSKSIP